MGATPATHLSDGFWSSLAFTEGTYPNQQVGAKGGGPRQIVAALLELVRPFSWA